MDMAFASFGNRFAIGTDAGIDFHALVAFLAAAQAAQPTSQLATRLALGGDRQMAVRESLIEIFAPQHGRHGLGNAPERETLRGSFNPAVPNSYNPSTIGKAR
jgi:hypothetical protein